MTGMSCAFIYTKSLDLSLYYFPFLLYIYNYAVIDSLAKDGYHKAFGSCEGFDLGNA